MDKLINLNNITIFGLKKWIKNYAKNEKIKVYFSKKKGLSFANVIDRKIFLSKMDKKSLVFAFFHEIGHFKIFEKNIFKIARNVYGAKSFSLLTKKEKIIFKQTNIKLEQWCDSFGEKESHQFFKNPNCYKPYHSEYGKKFLNNQYKQKKWIN